MMLPENLENAFYKYTKIVRKSLEQVDNREERKDVLRLVADRERKEFRDAVTVTERREEFKKLVRDTQALYRRSTEHAIKNFFRRSAYYIDILEGKTRNDREVFAEYVDSFVGEKTIRYLAPMSYVTFHENLIDLGDFAIRRFSKEELKSKLLFQKRINDIFYKNASFDVDDINMAIEDKKLFSYWFIECREGYQDKPTDEGFISWHEIGRIPLLRTDYHEIESILEKLVLFDWPLFSVSRSNGFDIPFLMNQCYLENPKPTPDFTKLELEEHYHSSTGQYLGQRPPDDSYFDEARTVLFRDFVTRITNILSKIRTADTGWIFMEVALDFLLKAFFARGIEEMIWHIVTIEALLGQNVESGLTNLLKDRLAQIWGDKDVGDRFKRLYDLRSAFIHGRAEIRKDENKLKTEAHKLNDEKIQKMSLIYDEDLNDARRIARGTLCWFLNYLFYMLSLNENPNRQNLLKLVDDNLESAFLQKIRATLPQEFPCVPSWLEEHNPYV